MAIPCRRFPRPYNPRPERGKMNQTEAAYAERLESMRNSGEIIRWKYEAVSLRLAKNTFSLPDFWVVKEDCIEIHEVKGWNRDDAWAKLKIAASMFPEFRFFLCRRRNKKTPWDVQEVEP